MNKAIRHPKTIRQSVLHFVRQHDLIQPGHHVILAVSGGIDSMVMLEVMEFLQSSIGFTVAVAHVNHGLRGKESDRDEAFVKKTADQYSVPFFATTVHTAVHAKEKKISVQESARELRYQYLKWIARDQKADRIATAHNANDNAETMLFNLFRGTGIRGLSGIPLRREKIIRPLLSLSRKEIAAYANAKKIRFREDKSNQKEAYTRNFLRHSLIPKIEERINPSLVGTLGRASASFGLLSEFVDSSVTRALKAVMEGSACSIPQFNVLHPFLRHAVIKQVLESYGVEATQEMVSEIVALKQEQKGTIRVVSPSLTVEKGADAIVFRTATTEKRFLFELAAPSELDGGHFRLSVMPCAKPRRHNTHTSGSSLEYVDAEKLQFPLTVRSWQPGDRFTPLGMTGTKKLSDFLGEQKLTAEEKSSVPIILSGDSVVWVGGMRLDERFKITESTRSYFQLKLQSHGTKNRRRQ